jgi:putative ABC transport system substrate-binding protein
MPAPSRIPRTAHIQCEEATVRSHPVVLLVLLVLSLFCALGPADAQQPTHVPRLGYLGYDATVQAQGLQSFLDGLRALGYVVGQNIVIEYRWTEGRFDRLPALAAELVGLPVDILVTAAGPLAVRAAQQATTTTPIVAHVMNDPVAAGFVASLARPGSNITGQAFQDTELIPKQVDLLRETVPQLSRLAVLWHAAGSGAPVVRTVEDAAQAVGLALHVQEVREPPELERTVAAAKTWGAQALLQLPSPFFVQHQTTFVALLTTHQLPALCETRRFVVEGCLIAYGVNFNAMSRRTAYYVDRILQGATPAGLPVERPREFELVMNRQTAHALGLTLSPLLLYQATEVVQ